MDGFQENGRFLEILQKAVKMKHNHNSRAMNGYGSPSVRRGGPVQKVAFPGEYVENPWKNEGSATAGLHYPHLVPTAEWTVIGKWTVSEKSSKTLENKENRTFSGNEMLRLSLPMDS